MQTGKVTPIIYKGGLETPIILPTRSTLRPDPSLRLRQSFARLLRSFSIHPDSVFVWVRPPFRSRAVGGVSSRGAAPNPAKTLCCIISNFECLWVILQLKGYFIFSYDFKMKIEPIYVIFKKWFFAITRDGRQKNIFNKNS